jgi:hypothetical protein
MSWKETLGAIAPTLATALGGPLAGAATAVISKELLGVDNGTEEQLANAIMTAQPEKLLSLKRADHQFKRQIKELDVRDRESARELAKGTTIWPQVTLSGMYTLGYFWLLFALASGDIVIPPDMSVMFSTLIGIMTAAQTQIMNFWFGSSSGSKDKTRAKKDD